MPQKKISNTKRMFVHYTFQSNVLILIFVDKIRQSYFILFTTVPAIIYTMHFYHDCVVIYTCEIFQ